MSRVFIGKWGQSLAVRLPEDVAKAAGLSDGEQVEIEAHDGDIVIRRCGANARNRAEPLTAAEEIIAESRHHPLGGVPIRELLDEGRRG
jgi:antitoxin MazE